MANSTVSAEPERLYQYASRGQELDQALISDGQRLERLLCHFEHKCTEPSFQVVASPLIAPVRDHAIHNQVLGEDVRQVGRRFVLADALQIGIRSRFGWVTHVRRHLPVVRGPSFVTGLLVGILGPPGWLISRILEARWIGRGDVRIPADNLIQEKERTEPDDSDIGPAPSDTLEVEGGPPSTSDEGLSEKLEAAPQSPFGTVDYRVTEGFGTYLTGSLKGRLHNGVDLKPKAYDPNETYDVYPIGPGKVYQASQQVKKEWNEEGERVVVKDAAGNPELVGYGNYVVVEHKRDDGVTYYSRYAHLESKPELEVGQPVDENTVLGQMGASGTAYGAHLHLELYNCEAESKYYLRHKPHEIYDEDKGTTWEDKMLEGYLNPIPIIEGDEDWEWDTEWLQEADD